MVDNKKNINIAGSPQLSNFNNSDDPKSYFSSQIEGKRNFGPRFDSKQNLIPYSIIGSKEIELKRRVVGDHIIRNLDQKRVTKYLFLEALRKEIFFRKEVLLNPKK